MTRIHRANALGGPPTLRPDDRKQRVAGEKPQNGGRVGRLDQVVGEPGGLGPPPVIVSVPPGHGHQDGRVFGPFLAQVPGRLETVHERHPQVQHDHIGAGFAGRLQGVIAVPGDRHLVSGESKDLGQTDGCVRVVVHDQYAEGWGVWRIHANLRPTGGGGSYGNDRKTWAG